MAQIDYRAQLRRIGRNLRLAPALKVYTESNTELRATGHQRSIEEVEEAVVVQVNPLREFGGWGIRTGVGGRIGVVMRGGEALEVVRTGGRRVVVTVDDAATGAALLNTLAGRARA